MKLILSLTATIALFFSAAAMAEFEFDKSKAYVGGGLAYNSPDLSGFDSAIGFQGFAGYDISDSVSIDESIGLSVEVGYASSGNFSWSGCSILGVVCEWNSNGLWSTAVFDYQVKDKIKTIGRIGYDLANASGLIIGAGGLYTLNEQMDVVIEYVIRNRHKGLQANFIYHL